MLYYVVVTCWMYFLISCCTGCHHLDNNNVKFRVTADKVGYLSKLLSTVSFEYYSLRSSWTVYLSEQNISVY
jgi:hypothetical protein